MVPFTGIGSSKAISGVMTATVAHISYSQAKNARSVARDQAVLRIVDGKALATTAV
jgi:hypothetical protein